MVPRKTAEPFVRKQGEGGGRQCFEIMLDAGQKEAVQIDEIPGYVKGDDLPAAVREQHRAGDESLDEQMAVRLRLLGRHEDLAGREAAQACPPSAPMAQI